MAGPKKPDKGSSSSSSSESVEKGVDKAIKEEAKELEIKEMKDKNEIKDEFKTASEGKFAWYIGVGHIH